jgi:hypothetical protein
MVKQGFLRGICLSFLHRSQNNIILLWKCKWPHRIWRYMGWIFFSEFFNILEFIFCVKGAHICTSDQKCIFINVATFSSEVGREKGQYVLKHLFIWGADGVCELVRCDQRRSGIGSRGRSVFVTKHRRDHACCWPEVWQTRASGQPSTH